MAIAPARVDAVMLEARASQVFRRSFEGEAKRAATALAVACMELDACANADTPATVRASCARAMLPAAGWGAIAAVCVRPKLVDVAVAALGCGPVRVAAAVGPGGEGSEPLEFALAAGAHEIEAGFDCGSFLAGRLEEVRSRIAAVKSACGAVPLRIVIDANELGSFAALRRAVDTALAAGADFVKTAKTTPPAAIPALALLLCEAVREFARRGGRQAGVAIGCAHLSPDAALGCVAIAAETLGFAWPAPERFRLESALPFGTTGAHGAVA